MQLGLQSCAQALLDLLSRIRRRVRLAWLNRQPGIKVSPHVQIAASAKIQPRSEGRSLGGSISIARGVTLSEGVVLAAYGGSIDIAENVYIGPYCIIYGHGGVHIGRDTMIAGHTIVVAANHGFSRLDIPMKRQDLTKEGVHIGSDVWIGGGSKVLDGVRINDGAILGAGSIATCDVPAYDVAVGNPARSIKSRQPG